MRAKRAHAEGTEIRERKTIQPTKTAFGAKESHDIAIEAERALLLVTSSLEDDKAENVVVIPLADKSSIADYMVIASGRSQRQVGAMAEHLREKLKAAGVKGISVEGAQRCDWVLIDAGDIIVHIFRPEVRSFYNLEKMWGLNLPDERSVSLLTGGSA
jgi:ribosome-associated protein